MKPSVLITGASSDTGKAIATALEKGFSLILTGSNPDKLSELQKCFKEATVFSLDLRELESIGPTLEDQQVRAEHLVHCAGYYPFLPLRRTATALSQDTFNINALSAIELTRHLSSKKQNPEGLKSAVFISSVASTRPSKGLCVYAASKAALESFAQQAASELAPKTRINCIRPGAMKTGGTQALFEDPDQRGTIESEYPLGLPEPKDIAEMTAYLLSEKAAKMSGQVITIDGGLGLSH